MPLEDILTKAIDFTFTPLKDQPILLNLEEFDRERQIKKLELEKDEMYYYLLKPYKCTKLNDDYVCKYEGWEKQFKKAWNALDHMRMHEGIRPYKCRYCDKSFTQKCNFKKHEKRHMIKTQSKH